MTRTQLGRPVGASGEETRQRIIVATMRCVAKVGYSRATIREIARMANVTSASLYNYFPNKSELIKATITARADAAMPRLRKRRGKARRHRRPNRSRARRVRSVDARVPGHGRVRVGDPG